jgi:hypothetical protein
MPPDPVRKLPGFDPNIAKNRAKTRAIMTEFGCEPAGNRGVTLNATTEGARAGDAGKGFAVGAREVNA